MASILAYREDRIKRDIIGKLRTEVFLIYREDKNLACFFTVPNNGAYESNILKQHFHIFRIAFHDFLLASYQNISYVG
jgi:hypothetical protein